jgi:hypothetical protein
MKKIENKIHNISHIHYLSIDVEGAEFEVIKSINFDKVFIDVIGFFYYRLSFHGVLVAIRVSAGIYL